MIKISNKHEAAAYKDIEIQGILSVITLKDMTLTEEINDHSRLYLTGLVPEAINNSIIFEQHPNQTIKILDTLNNKIFFQGIIENIEVQFKNHLYIVYVTAISKTKLMDIAPASQSFQNRKDTYSDVFDKLMIKYNPNDKYRLIKSDDKLNLSINKLIVQLDETDWEFAKRLASLLNIGLIPSAKSDQIDYRIGISEKESYMLPLVSYTLVRTPTIAKTFIDNQLITDSIEQEFFNYILYDCFFCLDVGDNVLFKNHNLYIIKKEAQITEKNALLKYKYTLASLTGIKQPKKYNEHMSGISIDGIVIDHTHAYSKLHLGIDKSQPLEEATWFRQSVHYAAGDYRGWTAMYDLADTILLYFPNEEENDVFTLKSNLYRFPDVKTEINFLEPYLNGGEIDVLKPELYPNNKLLYNPKKQTIVADNDDILITTRDQENYITISCDNKNVEENNGILIRTNGNLYLQSNSMSIGHPTKYSTKYADNVYFTGAEKVKLQCGSSNILLYSQNPVIDCNSPIIDIKRYTNQKRNFIFGKNNKSSDRFETLIDNLTEATKKNRSFLQSLHNMTYWCEKMTVEDLLAVVLSYDDIIEKASKKYSVPKEMIQTILFWEISVLGLQDIAVDLLRIAKIVSDSSTGFGQAYAKTAINAINSWNNEMIYDPKNEKDLQKVWAKLATNDSFSIEMIANILWMEANSRNIDISKATSDEIQKVFAAYNGSGDNAAAYGEAKMDYFYAFVMYNRSK